MTKLKVVKVAVENTALSFDALFDYLLPPELCDKAEAGCRVLVPFGRANINKIGMIFEVYTAEKTEKLKTVSALLDSEPIMSEQHLALSLYLSENTFCPIYEAVKTQLPAGVHLKLTESYAVKNGVNEETLSLLNPDELRVYKEVSDSNSPVSKRKLIESLGFVDDKIILGLIKKEVLSKVDLAKTQIGDKTLKSARLKGDYSEDIKLTLKQKSVVETLKDIGESSVKDICYFTGVTSAVINSLEKKGVIELFDAEILRVDIPSDKDVENVNSICLSDNQNKVYEGLKEFLNSDTANAALLYGVTGSGKTQVFLKLIGDCVKNGKQAIVMVPEISLTPQTVKTFYRYFGSKVAVLHSGLSVGERYDQYKRIKNGEISVVVGTRSAVFAPLDNIGIIVMDEEQEATYKSESSPRYHARDVAKFRCAKSGALLLLASATPSVDSFYNTSKGKYKLFRLDERFGGQILPDVTIVDMSDRDLIERDSAFSKTLLCEIEKNIQNKEQTILLYNRRGYHTVATCADCKQVVTCPHCSIALTYHKKNNRLMCHYCGYSTELYTECPSCNSKRLFYKGQGTQKVEDELQLLFPDARVLRMDLDNSSTKGEHQRKFDAFSKGEYDILVGTQMVAKGLNFKNVTLVGVLNADQTLYANDFRAYERAFSLITQVVGRSGRGEKSGRAIIQTLTPQNPIISLAAQQDYDSFFEGEISMRQAMLYPPFCDLCVVGFVSSQHERTKKAAENFVNMIKNKNPEEQSIPLRVLGPSPMNVVKVGGKYRYRLIIKCKNNKKFRNFLRDLLIEFQTNSFNKGISVYADLNEVSGM